MLYMMFINMLVISKTRIWTQRRGKILIQYENITFKDPFVVLLSYIVNFIKSISNATTSVQFEPQMVEWFFLIPFNRVYLKFVYFTIFCIDFVCLCMFLLIIGINMILNIWPRVMSLPTTFGPHLEISFYIFLWLSLARSDTVSLYYIKS